MEVKVIWICLLLFAMVIARGRERGESYVNHHLYAYKPQRVGHLKKEDYHTYPKYQFEYGVVDPHTGDLKMQYEERDGGVVRGYYSFHEADGTIRTVHYTVDKKSGFNARVVREGADAQHPKHKSKSEH